MPTTSERITDGLHSGQLGGSSNFFSMGDSRILGWIQEAVAEGERINRADPVYPKMDEAIAYIMGEQIRGNRPSYVPSVIINKTKQSISIHASALTDIRPLFGYKTFNGKFMAQASILNNLVQGWWSNTFADLSLVEIIKYSSACGAGDCLIEWDPHYSSLGDCRLISKDPRDILPIRPTHDHSLQNWEGVIIREAISPNALRAQYPEYADAILAESSSSQWGQLFTRFRRATNFTTPTSTLDGLNMGGKKQSSSVSPEVVIYRTYFRDRSINLNPEPVVMGTIGTNWAYTVGPGEPLYPRGRLIISTEKAIMYDGPNPYWHGMYPISRLRLDPWPWSFFGLGLCHDLMPLQDAINMTTNDFLSTFTQWTQRGIVADKDAMPEAMLKRLDIRKPNWKARIKAGLGDTFKAVDGPNLPAWTMPFYENMRQTHEEMSGTANLQALMQLRQMPGAETIDTYYKALTPQLRQEGRLLEAFLREVAEMVKVNFFQFYSSARRILLLGEPGKTLEDFDYDPDTLIPAMSSNDQGYIPELDAKLPRDVRAQFFHKLFTFYVAPNSVLSMHQQEKKLMYLQLSRQGYMDYWTLMEMMEIPNVGAPPPIPLPIRDYDPSKNLDPNTGVPLPPPLEVREPITITERLQAQQMMGLGQTQNPAGRKASGQAPPNLKQKSDGSSTVTESK